MEINKPIAVLGAGSWGTALAILLARTYNNVRLWTRNQAQYQAMTAERRNARFLPQCDFPSTLSIHCHLKLALANDADVLIVVPSHSFRQVLSAAVENCPSIAKLAWATKGLEPQTGKMLHQVAQETCGSSTAIAVLSGPTFAKEVASGLPTAVTVASDDEDSANYWASRLHSHAFRAYTCADLIGVQMGGAIKNVLAIAAGIADGLGLGANTRAALITRGLVEMTRLGVALGGRRETFFGLAGLGDLILTCTDDQSRNRRLGFRLANGEKLESALSAIGQEVEGVHTAKEIIGLARNRGIEMPIAEQVNEVLFAGLSPEVAVQRLLMREQKAE